MSAVQNSASADPHPNFASGQIPGIQATANAALSTADVALSIAHHAEEDQVSLDVTLATTSPGRILVLAKALPPKISILMALLRSISRLRSLTPAVFRSRLWMRMVVPCTVGLPP